MATVFAAPPDPQIQRTVVHYGDLNLTYPEDVLEVYSRLRRAAKQVCPFADATLPWLRATGDSCVTTAVGLAVKDINAPVLTDYYNRHKNQ